MSFEPLIPVGLSLFSSDREQEDEKKKKKEGEVIPADETQTSGAFEGFSVPRIHVVMLVYSWVCAQSMPVSVSVHPCILVCLTVPCYIL